MSPEDSAFMTRLLQRLVDNAERSVRGKIPSRALRDALQKFVGRTNGALYLPHYWAVFIHDGRKPFGPKRAKVLVWFRNPADDPRLREGYPVRLRDVKRLTKEQFREGLARNRELGGGQPFMIVRPFQKKALAGAFFFTEGMKAFEKGAAEIIAKEFDKHIRRQVARIKQPKPAVCNLS